MSLFGGKSTAKMEQDANIFSMEQFVLGCQHKHTPDFSFLSRRPFHRVFIYDGFMSSHTHQKETEGFGKYQAVAVTAEPFELWKRCLGKFSHPLALPTTHKISTKSLPVKGELWAISFERLLELDIANENGVQFRRIRVELDIPYRKVKLFLKNRIEFPRGENEEPLIVSELNPHIIPQIAQEHRRRMSAWMYIAVPEYWKTLLDGGYSSNLVRRYGKMNEAEYYYFSPKEFND